MPTSTSSPPVLESLRFAWARSDRIFGLLADDAWLQRPIPLRHPFLFYLGHLPAFAWNQVAGGLLGRSSTHARFDTLFERGIDPGSESQADASQASTWPDRDAVLAYRDTIREELPGLWDAVLARAAEQDMARDGRIFEVVLEHELMHHETLLYMVQQLDRSLLRPAADVLPDPATLTRRPPPAVETVTIPAGVAHLGADESELSFGWDNEFPRHDVPVEAFVLDRHPVTHARFLEFVEAGGYAKRPLWSETAWRRIEALGLRQPGAWVGEGGERRCRTLLGDVPWDIGAGWPITVTADEADAFARWSGRRLPTEAEWHHAAHGRPDDQRCRWPWGDDPPEARRGNFGFRHWAPTPVDAHPDGASAFGVLDMLGNTWEWTASTFAPFPGFRATMPHYPGYSADFFDGEHRVVLGGSWATDIRLQRPSFRNWYRADYPYALTGFRLAGEVPARG